MSSVSRFCLLFGASPMFLLIVSWLLLLTAFGCADNLGPGVATCERTGSGVGNALHGLLWVGALGWLFTIPAALVLAIVAKGLGIGDEKRGAEDE
jgi:hypothetical protein